MEEDERPLSERLRTACFDLVASVLDADEAVYFVFKNYKLYIVAFAVSSKELGKLEEIKAALLSAGLPLAMIEPYDPLKAKSKPSVPRTIERKRINLALDAERCNPRAALFDLTVLCPSREDSFTALRHAYNIVNIDRMVGSVEEMRARALDDPSDIVKVVEARAVLLKAFAEVRSITGSIDRGDDVFGVVLANALKTHARYPREPS